MTATHGVRPDYPRAMPALPPSFLVRLTTDVPQLPDGSLDWSTWERLAGVSAGAGLDAESWPLAVTAGWTVDGLWIGLEISGKTQPPSAKAKTPEEADSVILCIDTRDTKNIRRAGRFCHRFRVAASKKGDTRVSQEFVPRAREDSPMQPNEAEAISEVTEAGYRVLVSIPAANLTGFAPQESPRIGFFAILIDRELGTVPMAGDTRLPLEADPSLWTSLRLVAAD